MSDHHERLLSDPHDLPTPLPPSTSISPPPLPPSPPSYTSTHLYTPHRWPLTSIPRHISYPLAFTYFFLSIAQSLPTTAISFLMIYSISLSPALLNTTYTLWFQAGVTRPLWGLLSDQFPIFGYRRRPYLLLTCLLCIVCTLLMGWEVTGSGAVEFIAWGLGVYLFWAVAEAMTDSVVVEMGNAQVVEALERLGLGERSREEQRERRREYGMETEDDRRHPTTTPTPSPLSAFSRYTSPVDIVTQRVKARLQAECMAVRTVGTIIAYALSIGLLRVAEREWREVVIFNAVSFFPAMISACFIQEKSVKVGWYGMTAVTVEGTIPLHVADTDSEEDVEEEMTQAPHHSPAPQPITPAPLPSTRMSFLKAKWTQLSAALRVAFYPLLFILCYYAVPSSSDTYYYFLYGGTFSFEAWQADLFSFISLLGALAGTLCYSRYLSSTPIARLFLLTTVLGTCADSLKFLLVFQRTEWVGMSPGVYIPVVGVVGSFIGGIRNMLPIVLAHQHAPRVWGMEGSMFSLFQTADRMGVLISGGVAAWMTEGMGIESGQWGRLWELMLVCMALEWVPLVLVPFMLKRKPPPDVEIDLQTVGKRGRGKRGVEVEVEGGDNAQQQGG